MAKKKAQKVKFPLPKVVYASRDQEEGWIYGAIEPLTALLDDCDTAEVGQYQLVKKLTVSSKPHIVEQ